MAQTLRSGAANAPQYVDKFNLMVSISAAGDAVPVESPEDWEIRRSHILANMQLVMGDPPPDTRRCALDVHVLEEVQTERYSRRKITYMAEEGDRVPAYLFIPTSVYGRVPGIVCLHQTTTVGKAEPAGIDGLPNLHYAGELAERGYVTIAPDYPGYGDYQFDAYANGYVSATMKGIYNHSRAIDVLASLPEVDGERIGCIGHSLGGHNTLFLAAFDERVGVAVTSCGFSSFRKYKDGDIAGWSHKGYMPRIADLYGARAETMPFEFSEVLGAIAPRAVFVNAPTGDTNFPLEGVLECLAAAQPVYALYGAHGRLEAAHPECGHDFPPEVREQAYAFIDSVLKG